LSKFRKSRSCTTQRENRTGRGEYISFKLMYSPRRLVNSVKDHSAAKCNAWTPDRAVRARAKIGTLNVSNAVTQEYVYMYVCGDSLGHPEQTLRTRGRRRSAMHVPSETKWSIKKFQMNHNFIEPFNIPI